MSGSVSTGRCTQTKQTGFDGSCGLKRNSRARTSIAFPVADVRSRHCPCQLPVLLTVGAAFSRNSVQEASVVQIAERDFGYRFLLADADQLATGGVEI